MKKFKTVDGGKVRVALTSGHVYNITGDWKEIPERAYSAAYSQGCISEDMITGKGEVGLTTEVMSTINMVALEKKDIEDAIRTAMDNGDEDFFTISGTPKIPKVSGALGRRVDSATVKEVWSLIESDRDIEIELD